MEIVDSTTVATSSIIPIIPVNLTDSKSALSDTNHYSTLNNPDDPGEVSDIVLELKKQLKVSLDEKSNKSEEVEKVEINPPSEVILNETKPEILEEPLHPGREIVYDDDEAKMYDDYADEVEDKVSEKKAQKKRDLTGEEWGVMIPGACLKGCAFGFYLFSIVSSIINCFGASGRIGNLLVNYRCDFLIEIFNSNIFY